MRADAAAVTASSPLACALASCSGQLLAVGVFSGVVNILQLTVSIYMTQVFDRVLSTRNLNTLLYLTLIAIAALGLLALLEAARLRIVQRIGAWMEETVAPEGLARAVESQLRGRPYRMEALRELAVCRSYVASPGAASSASAGRRSPPSSTTSAPASPKSRSGCAPRRTSRCAAITSRPRTARC